MTVDSPKSREEKGKLLGRYKKIAAAACARLALNQQVRRNLPGKGRLRVDRQLPFLCLYREPVGGNDPGTRELITTEAAYLFGSGSAAHHEGLMLLCQQVNAAMQEHFGTFLIIEVWAQPHAGPSDNHAPDFEIISPDRDSIPSTIETFEAALKRISINGRMARVVTRPDTNVGPAEARPLEPICNDSGPGGCCVLGLAVQPVFRDEQRGTLFPIVLHSLRRQLATAIRQAVASFTGTADEEPDAEIDAAAFHALGPSSLVKAARLIDQQLCEVSESFDLLLQVTPTNAAEAQEEFRLSGFKDLPVLRYRPLPFHPNLLKRQLFDIEIERIEDPTLAHLCWEKQDELDRQLTALRDIGTPDFLYSSLQLYGEPSEALLDLARQILSRLPETPPGQTAARCVDAAELLQAAREEIDYYHTRMNEFNATIEPCEGIAAGIMVSRGRLLVSKTVSLPETRVEALLHHEIGTHLLTYFNGRCQPFRQLYAGLAGYEELQEGLAVLAECLVGGMTNNRWRTLAGRVVAVTSMIDGCEFAETFALLHEDHGFSEHRAFAITLRVYRGGGLTKDLIYLRGLSKLLEYLAAGHEIQPLYVGKIGLQHVPFVQEMRRRKIIVPPRTLPRFWDDDGIRDRMKACRDKSVLQLLEIDR